MHCGTKLFRDLINFLQALERRHEQLITNLSVDPAKLSFPLDVGSTNPELSQLTEPEKKWKKTVKM